MSFHNSHCALLKEIKPCVTLSISIILHFSVACCHTAVKVAKRDHNILLPTYSRLALDHWVVNNTNNLGCSS